MMNSYCNDSFSVFSVPILSFVFAIIFIGVCLWLCNGLIDNNTTEKFSSQSKENEEIENEITQKTSKINDICYKRCNMVCTDYINDKKNLLMVVELQNYEIVNNELNIYHNVYIKVSKGSNRGYDLPELFDDYSILEPTLDGKGKLNSEIENVLRSIVGEDMPIEHCFSLIGEKSIETIRYKHSVTVLDDRTIKISVPLMEFPINRCSSIECKRLFYEFARKLNEYLINWFSEGMSCIDEFLKKKNKSKPEG